MEIWKKIRSKIKKFIFLMNFIGSEKVHSPVVPSLPAELCSVKGREIETRLGIEL
jgi:hypothetical protein